MGEGRSGEQGGVGEGRGSRPAGSHGAGGARWHRSRPAFYCHHLGGTVNDLMDLKEWHKKVYFSSIYAGSVFVFPGCIATAPAQVSPCTQTLSCPISWTMAARSRFNDSSPTWLLGSASVPLPWQSQEQAGPGTFDCTEHEVDLTEMIICRPNSFFVNFRDQWSSRREDICQEGRQWLDPQRQQGTAGEKSIYHLSPEGKIITFTLFLAQLAHFATQRCI